MNKEKKGLIENLQEQFQKAHQKQESDKAWDFLRKFKIDAEKVSQQLQLGWADHRFTKSLAPRTTQKGVEQRNQLKQYGVLEAETGRPVVYGLTMPLYNEVGEVVNLHSLSLGREEFEERHHQVNELGEIWNTDSSEVVIVSNPFELIPLSGFGVTNAVYVGDLKSESFAKRLETLTKITTIGTLDLSDLDIPIHRFETELLKGKSLIEFCQSDPFSKDFVTKLISFAPLVSGQSPAQTTQTLSYEERNGHHYTKIEDRHYRLTGVTKVKELQSIKITLQVWREGNDQFHTDSLDLCLSKKRERYAHDASAIGLSYEKVKRDLGKILTIAEEIFYKRQTVATHKVSLTTQQVSEATEYLSSSDLVENITSDLKACDLVGDEALVAYFAGVSRLTDRPIPLIAPSCEFIERACAFFPPEQVSLQSSLSAKSLLYLGDQWLGEGIVAVTGGETLSDDFYQLLKNGRLRTLVVERDKEVNAMVTSQKEVETAPMMLMSESSASDKIREHSLSLRRGSVSSSARGRSLEAIQKRAGCEMIYQKHHSIQRMLKPYTIVNEYSEDLVFESPRAMSRELYLRLIDAVCLLRQYHKKVETVGDLEVIRVEAEDIRVANKVAKRVFAHSSFCDLPQRISQGFELICGLIEKGEHFTRRKFCEWGGYTVSTAKNYLDKLVEAELILPVKGSKGQKFEYQLLHDSLQEPEAIELTVPQSAIQSDTKRKPVKNLASC